MNYLTKLLAESKKKRDASTKTTWWPHVGNDCYGKEASVRGPFFRWFKCTEVDEKYNGNVSTALDDCRFAAHSMNTAEAKDEIIAVLAEALTKIYLYDSQDSDGVKMWLTANKALEKADSLAKEALEK